MLGTLGGVETDQCTLTQKPYQEGQAFYGPEFLARIVAICKSGELTGTLTSQKYNYRSRMGKIYRSNLRQGLQQRAIRSRVQLLRMD